eukprot:9411520-Pyramimonas_sp.AAC.1
MHLGDNTIIQYIETQDQPIGYSFNASLPNGVTQESEADLESHVMEVGYAELQEEKELLEATPPEDLFAIPTHM